EVRNARHEGGEPRRRVVVREDSVSESFDESLLALTDDVERLARVAVGERRQRLPTEPLILDVLAAGGVVHLAQRHRGGTGVVTAHAVRTGGDRVVYRVVLLALESPLFGSLELRAGALVVDLGDRTGCIARRTLVTVVRARAEVHLGRLEDVYWLELVGVVGWCVAHVYHWFAAAPAARPAA